jgi:hypothetical protein
MGNSFTAPTSAACDWTANFPITAAGTVSIYLKGGSADEFSFCSTYTADNDIGSCTLFNNNDRPLLSIGYKLDNDQPTPTPTP